MRFEFEDKMKTITVNIAVEHKGKTYTLSASRRTRTRRQITTHSRPATALFQCSARAGHDKVRSFRRDSLKAGRLFLEQKQNGKMNASLLRENVDRSRSGSGFIVGVPLLQKPFAHPFGAVRWKLRFRNRDFARAFVKFPDRIEHWILQENADHIYCGVKQGENRPQIKDKCPQTLFA